MEGGESLEMLAYNLKIFNCPVQILTNTPPTLPTHTHLVILNEFFDRPFDLAVIFSLEMLNPKLRYIVIDSFTNIL